MANWLSRAKSLFQKPPPPPEPYEVECDCGGKVVGQRNKTYQKPNCTACGRPIFVLPLNVYPRPTPKSKPKKSSEIGGNSISAKISANTVAGIVPPPIPAGGTTPAKPAPVQVVVEQSVVEPSMLREPSRPVVTPLRLIVTAVILMTAVMVGGLWHRHRIETAKSNVARAADAGMAALHEKDFGKASHELETARAAVDVIGRTDAAANDIRRFSREAKAIFNLATSSLTDLIQSALFSLVPQKSVPAKTISLERGSWVIFDANILPASEGKNRYMIDAPMLFPEATVRIEIESPAFKHLRLRDDSGDAVRVIFASQLGELASPTGEPPIAVLTLNGKSAFLWTSYETFSAAGYRPIDVENEQQTRAVLEHQWELQQK